eukprot:116572_1
MSSVNLDNNVQKGIDKMKKRFNEVEILLNDLMGNQLEINQITNEMSTIEKAKFHATLAYCIQTLYNIHLRLKNEETRIDSSDVEINRVKQYILKIKNTINAQNSTSKPRMRLDKAAAKRFIAHNVDKDIRDKMHEKFGDEMKRKNH